MSDKLRIGITGANGMIGTRLTEAFGNQGYELTLFTRSEFNTPYKLSVWKPYVGEIRADDLEGLDVVIHLAGKNLAAGRWSDKFKKELIESRVQSGELLCSTLAKVRQKPRLLISMSAVGYYGFHPPEKVIDESASNGNGFLADLCTKWESATKAAEEAGIRTIHLRTGVVLSTKGGALSKMLPIFRMGVGGKLGNGEQVWSWIALDEIPQVMNFLIEDESLSGAVNNCTPNPVSNKEFTSILGDILNRPTFLPAPAFAIRMVFGSEMADETALKGARVVPKKLVDAGYRFEYPDLKQALHHILARD